MVTIFLLGAQRPRLTQGEIERRIAIGLPRHVAARQRDSGQPELRGGEEMIKGDSERTERACQR